MLRLFVICLSLFTVQSALAAVAAGAYIKVQSNKDIEHTSQEFLLELKKNEIPVRETSEYEEKLPGGFSRKVKEIKFSSPYYGWNLGECHRGERKDMPLTAKIYQDNQHRVWLEYTSPEAHMNNYGVIECGNETDKVRRTLTEFANAATE